MQLRDTEHHLANKIVFTWFILLSDYILRKDGENILIKIHHFLTASYSIETEYCFNERR